MRSFKAHDFTRLLAIGAVFAGFSYAADFSFSGAFQQDDERRNFTVTLSKSAVISVRTLSFGGGPNAAGAVVTPGGFDPTLSIFNGSGSLVAVNRDAGCGSASREPITSYCWDSRIDASLTPGTYQVVLTESENLPLGPTVSIPFVYDGTGNFTASPSGSPSNGFWDYSLHRRTGSFSLDIRNVDSASLGFVPHVTALTNSASNLAGQLAPNTALTYYAPNLPARQLTIRINGLGAAILYSGSGQINFVVPQDVPVGATASLEILDGSTLLLSTALPVVVASPAIFTSSGQGTGQGAILNRDSSANGPANAAARGSIIQVYGTGFGAALPPDAGGLRRLALGVTATIGGVPAQVDYAGLVPNSTPGLQQFNVVVPPNAPTGNAISVQLTIEGIASQPGVTVAIGAQ